MSLTGKVAGEIAYWGGGVLKLKQVQSTGADLSPTPGAIEDVGYIDDFGLQLTEEDAADVSDERGTIVQHRDGIKKFKLTGMLKQTGKALLDFLAAAQGKYYQFYYKSTKTGEMNGKTQEIFGAIGRITPQFDTKAKVKQVPFEITLLDNASAITIAADMMTATAYGSVNTAAATIGASQYYTIIET